MRAVHSSSFVALNVVSSSANPSIALGRTINIGDAITVIIPEGDLTLQRITDLLMITKLLTVFETFESEPDALKSYS